MFLQEPVGKDKDGNEMTLIDKLSCEGEDVFDEVNLKLCITELYKTMKSALEERERRVIEMRYGLCGTDALTQNEISSQLGISRSYVSRIEKKALRKLCTVMEDE